jgi:hypothetical protein
LYSAFSGRRRPLNGAPKISFHLHLYKCTSPKWIFQVSFCMRQTFHDGIAKREPYDYARKKTVEMNLIAKKTII